MVVRIKSEVPYYPGFGWVEFDKNTGGGYVVDPIPQEDFDNARHTGSFG